MSSTLLHFYDAATPENVPTGSHAAVYVNGFAWTQSEVDRMAAVFRVSVDNAASWAALARCIDVENGAASPSDAVAFLLERRYTFQHNDGTVYVNRFNGPAVLELVREHNLANPDRQLAPRLWVATLDGTQDVVIDGVKAWAVQYAGGADRGFDLSVLHGVNDFHRPTA